MLKIISKISTTFLLLCFIVGQGAMESVTKYHDDGMPEEIKYYSKAGNKIVLSKIEVYHKNGQMSLETNYSADGELDGLWVSYYENGQIHKKVNYRDGKKNGVALEYFESGQIRGQGNFKNDKGHGRMTEYYSNGQIKEKISFKDGEIHGEGIRYYRSGQLEEQVNFIDGEMDGQITRYYENGQIKEQGAYKEDEMDGVFTEYYENGQIKEKATFNYGKLNGRAVRYYENGQIKKDENYIDGLKHGKFISYDKQGTIVTEENYSEDRSMDPPEKPSIPIPSEDEFYDGDIVIEDTDFDDFDDWVPPTPAPVAADTRFVPFDKAPAPKVAIWPIYPELARESGIQGTVNILFFINEEGVVTEAHVLKGVPNSGLNQAALDAVKKSTWEPARQRDRKVGVWQTVPVKFELN